MKNFLFTLATIFAVMVSGTLLHAQTKQQQEVLTQLSEQFSMEFLAKKTEAIALAEELGIPWRREYGDGRVVELMRFDDGIPFYYTTFNAEGATVIKSDKVYPGGGAGLNLTGTGITLGMWDGGAMRIQHQEFGGRAVQRDNATSVIDHATHVAGTMMAGGVQAAAKGMSYQANMDAYDWNNDNSEMAAAAANGLKVSQHSYGTIAGWAYGDWSGNQAWHWFGNTTASETEDYKFGFYSNDTRDWDLIAHNAPNYLIVKSAGNDRGDGPSAGTFHYVRSGNNWTGSTTVREIDGGTDGYDCIPLKGNAKNILTVGAVKANWEMTDFSGWGPTDDGRIKPDVVAKGHNVYSPVSASNTSYNSLNGTSMSGPMVSGSIGLIQQHFKNLYPQLAAKSSTVKALIIHSANDAISGSAGPDYRFGWGLMDTEKAVEIISDNIASGGIHLGELTLNNGQQLNLPFRAKGGEPFRVTIVWNDVPGTPPNVALNPATSMLVNDLDLKVTSNPDQTYLPYVLNPANPSAAATTGVNTRDNVEMVHIQSPVAGQLYNISVSHTGSLTGGSQNFSIVITGNIAASSVDDPQNFSATAASDVRINLSWVKNTSNDQVMLVWSPTNAFGQPVDGTLYNAGQAIPGGGTVLYRGTDNGYSHLGLSPGTTYYYKAFSKNSSNTYSSGISANATTTGGSQATLPFYEDFNASNNLPVGWQIIDHQGNGQIWQFGTHDGGLNGTTGNYAFLNSDAYGEGNSQNTDLITPVFDLSQFTNITLAFTHYFRQYQNSQANLYYSINGGASWELISQWTTNTSNPSQFSQIIAPVAGQQNVRFKWNYVGAWDYYWDIDDIAITGAPVVALPTVTTASISNITQTTAQGGGNVTDDGGGNVNARGLVWNVTGTPSLTNNVGFTTNGNGTGPFTSNLTGLSSGTTYYVRAYATNSAGTAYGSQLSFTTTGGGLPETLPFFEDFNASNNLPNGWQIVDLQGNGQVWQFGTHSAGLAGTSGNYAYLNSDAYGDGNSQHTDLITPLFDLSGYSNITLTFKHFFRQYQTSSATLYYSVNGGSSWVQIMQWSNSTTNPAAFNEVIHAVAGQQQVRFKWTYSGSWDYYWDIDDVSITGNPAGSLPSIATASVSSITQNSAQSGGNVSGDGGSAVSARGVVWNTTGTPSLGSNLGFTSNGTGTGQYSSMLTGLSSGTTYFVRAYATNASGTAYGNQLSFTTTSGGALLRLPFTENFNNAASLPNGWEIVDHEGNGQVWEFGTHTEGLAGFAGYYAYIDSDAYGEGNMQDADLITPAFDLSDQINVTLRFKHFFRQYENSLATLYYSIDGGSNWVQIQQWTNSTTNPESFNRMITPVSNKPNVRFKWNYKGNWDYYWDIDDVSLTGIVSLSENITSQQRVYPNPFNDLLAVESDEPISEIRICSLDGRVLLNELINDQKQFTLEASLLPAGVYVLYLTAKSQRRVTIKIVKQ